MGSLRTIGVASATSVFQYFRLRNITRLARLMIVLVCMGGMQGTLLCVMLQLAWHRSQ